VNSQAPASDQAHHSAGHAFRRSPAVHAGIDSIVQELQRRQQTITGTRGPTSDASKLSFDEFMQRAADVRGRGLFYPFVGSGFGRGPLVELMDGSVKYDMITGIGVRFFGYSDPDLVRASLQGGLEDVPMQGHLMQNESAIEFAEILVQEAARTSNIKHAFLCGSGAMANENALKVCYQKNHYAPRVIAFSGCFMGRSTTMAQIGDNAGGRQGIPLSTLVDYMPFYDHIAARRMSAGDVSGPTRYIDMCVWHLEQYLRRYPGQHACFIFELVQGEGGFNTALPEYHKALMQVCKDHGVAVWSDEVQTFGRTERMYCFEALGLGEYVDVVSIGKMSQVCAALFTDEYNPNPGLLSGTFLGSTSALHVGKRVLERLRDDDYYSEMDGHGKVVKPGRIHKHHQLFRDHVAKLARKHPDWFAHNNLVHEIASGYGGMLRLTPFAGRKEHVMKLCHVCYEEGLIVFYCGHGPFHLRMLPPLGVMHESDWDPVFDILERAMAKVAAEMPEPELRSIRPMHRPLASDDASSPSPNGRTDAR